MHLKITPIYIYPQLHHFFFFSLQLFFFFFFSSPDSLCYSYSYHYHDSPGHILITPYIPLSYLYPYYYHCGVFISSLASLSSTSTSPLPLSLYILPSSCSSSQCPRKHRICILPLQTLPLTRLLLRQQQQQQQQQRHLPAIRAPKSPPDLSSPFKPPHSRERLAVRQPVSLFR